MQRTDLSIVVVSVCLVASAPAWELGRAGFVSKSFAGDLFCNVGCVAPLCFPQPRCGHDSAGSLRSFPGPSGERHFIFHCIV